jgi:hypothetical protein
MKSSLKEEIERAIYYYDHFDRYSNISFFIPIKYPSFNAIKQKFIVENWRDARNEQMAVVRSKVMAEYDANQDSYDNHLNIIGKRLSKLGNVDLLIERIHSSFNLIDSGRFFKLLITNYGVAGSYYPKDGIIKVRIRENYDRPKKIEFTIAHELVHIIIENEINVSPLTHNEKECLMEVATMKILDLSQNEYPINAAASKVFAVIGPTIIADLFEESVISIEKVVHKIVSIR